MVSEHPQLGLYKEIEYFKDRLLRSKMYIRLIWLLHYSITIIVLIIGILVNQDQYKYIPIRTSTLIDTGSSSDLCTSTTPRRDNNAAGIINSNNNETETDTSTSNLLSSTTNDNLKKVFLNTLSISRNDSNAMICCFDNIISNNDLEAEVDFDDDDHYLCNPDNHITYFSKRLTRLPDAWIIPLIPFLIRYFVIYLTKLLTYLINKNNTTRRRRRNSDKITSSTEQQQEQLSKTTTTTSTSSIFYRIVFYFVIMNIRGFVLFLLVNEIEDIYFTSTTVSSSLEKSNCWYEHLLSKSRSCLSATMKFDSSDHVVLFYGQILSISLTEVIHCFVLPFWFENKQELHSAISKTCQSFKEKATTIKSSNHNHLDSSSSSSASTSNDASSNITTTSTTASSSMIMTILYLLHCIVTPISLIAYITYLYVISLHMIYRTSAYFHSSYEILFGYVISLVIQLPLAYIQCSGFDNNNNNSTGIDNNNSKYWLLPSSSYISKLKTKLFNYPSIPTTTSNSTPKNKIRNNNKSDGSSSIVNPLISPSKI